MIRFGFGIALARVGRLEEALAEEDLAAACFHEVAEADGEAQALAQKGDVLLGLGRFRDAIPAYESCRRLTEYGDLPVAGTPHAKGTVENHLGAALYLAARYRDAITAQERAVTLFQEAGDRAGEATAQNALGQALGGSGRVDEAIAAYRAAATIFRRCRIRSAREVPWPIRAPYYRRRAGSMKPSRSWKRQSRCSGYATAGTREQLR